MNKSGNKTLRCAIYTRVSTDSGLEQEFNSLDAQREASEAYIKSQANEGWRLIKTSYDDGGFSGGNLERPALQKLLEDVKAKLIDIILVYKVDRLTRSLADFAKLVELFDAHSVSFVSVTQAFNTTSSMGRLTLNVLLSFAQFEREVTGERIRDKIAASKKKGIWMGGTVPLGYRVQNRKLLVDADEAKIVQMIFERYLALGSMLPLLTELNGKDIRTRVRTLDSGRTVGGVPLTRGPLSHLLKNRTYLGEINHHSASYPGEHPAIIDKDLFDKVQVQLKDNLQVHVVKRSKSKSCLIGKIFDDRGNLMSPTFSKKGQVRYRYYLSRVLIEGRGSEAGSVRRVPAQEVEDLIVGVLTSEPAFQDETKAPGTITNYDLVQKFIERIRIEKGKIVITFSSSGVELVQKTTVSVPWTLKPFKMKRKIILPHIDPTKDQRPIRAETRASLVRAIAMGRQWLHELSAGRVQDTDEIAQREGRSKRSVHMMISLAFLAPDIVEAVVRGQMPRGIGITRLIDLPPKWSKQREMLGLAQSA